MTMGYDAFGGGGPSMVPIGSLKTLDGFVHQWDGTRWYNTGVRDGDTRESSRLGDTVNIAGRVMQWNPETQTYDIDLGSSSGPSAGPAPRYPQAGIENGRTYTVDPYTGQITFGEAVPGSFSEEQKRQNELFDIAGARRFTTGERVSGEQFSAGQAQAGRQFTAGENAATRQQTAEENALNRALEAGQFSATLATQQKRDQFAAEQDYQNRIRQYAQDKLSAAQAFASQVGAVDPAALEAFYAAGGGNIANALAGGASAVSDNAVLPAARSLRATREMVTPERYGGFDTPYQVPPTPTMAAGGRPAPAPTPLAAPFTAPKPAPIAYKDVGGGSVGMGPNGESPLDRPGTPDFARYAFGTMGEPATGTFITGDSTHPTDPFAGGAKPEKVTVKDPPGENNAHAEVEPMAPPQGMGMGAKPKLAELFHVIGSLLDEEQMGMGGMGMMGGMGEEQPMRMNMGGMMRMMSPDEMPEKDMPRYAYGTGGVASPYETITTTPEDQPYVDEVRGIRDRVQFPNLNPYDTKFRLNPYSMQQRFYAGRQTKFGVPIGDQMQEQERYQLGGIGRGNFSLGV